MYMYIVSTGYHSYIGNFILAVSLRLFIVLALTCTCILFPCQCFCLYVHVPFTYMYMYMYIGNFILTVSFRLYIVYSDIFSVYYISRIHQTSLLSLCTCIHVYELNVICVCTIVYATSALVHVHVHVFPRPPPFPSLVQSPFSVLVVMFQYQLILECVLPMVGTLISVKSVLLLITMRGTHSSAYPVGSQSTPGLRH